MKQYLSRAPFASFALLVLPLFGLPSAQASPLPTYAQELQDQAVSLRLDQSPQWRALMHYRSRWLGGLRSEIDAPAFFASPDGKKDPKAELQATIARFFDPVQPPAGPVDAPLGQQHWQCVRADRFQWLDQQLHFDSARLARVPCPELDQWKQALAPESVSLTFASSFMGDPSSMFGHSLLRINHRGHRGSQRLLDYGVNYAADVTTNNAFLYGLLGLTGGFWGTFSNLPYHLKVAEYGRMEARDLWEYDIVLTPEELDRFVLHLWSLGHAPTAYFYLGRNCSYMLLTLLDAARPSLALADDFPASAIPADTLRAAVARPGLVSGIRHRPSIATIVRHQWNALTDEERARTWVAIDPASAESALTALGTAELDAALNWMRWKKKQSDVTSRSPLQLRHEALLQVRAQKPISTPYEERVDLLDPERRPDHGHPTARVSLTGGWQKQGGGFAELGWRGALHDLNTRKTGYAESAQVELLNGRIRFYPDRARLRLERLNLIDLVALSPLTALERHASWSAGISAGALRQKGCVDCTEFTAQVQGGAAIRPFSDSALLYTLVGAEGGWIGALSPRYRLGPAATAGLLLDLGPNWGWHTEIKGALPLFGDPEPVMVLRSELRRTLSNRWELRAAGARTPVSWESSATASFYY